MCLLFSVFSLNSVHTLCRLLNGEVTLCTQSLHAAAILSLPVSLPVCAFNKRLLLYAAGESLSESPRVHVKPVSERFIPTWVAIQENSWHFLVLRAGWDTALLCDPTGKPHRVLTSWEARAEVCRQLLSRYRIKSRDVNSGSGRRSYKWSTAVGVDEVDLRDRQWISNQVNINTQTPRVKRLGSPRGVGSIPKSKRSPEKGAGSYFRGISKCKRSPEKGAGSYFSRVSRSKRSPGRGWKLF